MGTAEAAEAAEAIQSTASSASSAPLDLYSRVEGSVADTFISWKGTDVCLEFYCPCGAQGHIEGYFADVLRCPACEATYRLGTQVLVQRCDPSARTADPLARQPRTLDVDPGPLSDPG